MPRGRAALDGVSLGTPFGHHQTPTSTVTRRKPTRRIVASAPGSLRVGPEVRMNRLREIRHLAGIVLRHGRRRGSAHPRRSRTIAPVSRPQDPPGPRLRRDTT
ncbi:hypothetical protein FRIGORI9N_370110 [Frigoribacterium sp. 9N]|nr:hypothetical protein FRIGORI9N_370110 [Frigoribacterium sp. 9N]